MNKRTKQIGAHKIYNLNKKKKRNKKCVDNKNTKENRVLTAKLQARWLCREPEKKSATNVNCNNHTIICINIFLPFFMTKPLRFCLDIYVWNEMENDGFLRVYAAVDGKQNVCLEI